MSAALTAELKRLGNLIQNKDVSSDDLVPLARINILVRDFHKEGMFFNSDEKPSEKDTDNIKKARKIAINEQELAESRFKSYLESSELESTSDIDTLKSLIFNEVLESRVQKKLNEEAKDNKYPNDKVIKSLVDIQDQKAKLKVKLGIDRKDEDKDDLSALQLLQKRVKKHINENRNEFTLWVPWTCEKCNHKDIESYLLYKQVKDFSQLKHPWFAGRYLFNFEIIKDVKDKKLSLEDATRFLMCAGQGGHYKLPKEDRKWCTDYLKYCLDNFTEITDLLGKN